MQVKFKKNPNQKNLTIENITQILTLQKHPKQLMLIVSNRSQVITYSEIKVHLEKVTKKEIIDDIFMALFSVDPESYRLYEMNKTVCLQIVSKHQPITPKILEDRRTRFKDNLR